MRIIVQRSLCRADELTGRSVAFPAIGTGNLKFPPKEAARIMLDETVKYCHANPTSNLRDIRFLLLSRDKIVIDAFSQAMSRPENNPRLRNLQQESAEMFCRNVEIVPGDLTKEFQSEAIVNVIGSDMNIERAGSLSERIFRAAGSSLKDDFRRLLVQSGKPKALWTSGGKLSASHVIHIIPGSSDKQEIKKSLQRGFFLAKQNNIRSISLPAVGTGGHGLSFSDSARITFQALENVWGSCTKFPKVRVVILQSSELIQAFEQEKHKHKASLYMQGGSRRKTRMGRINIEVVEGDLTCEKTDAIVNIVNADMDMENAGELSREISRACGIQVKEECKRLGQQPGGSAVITSGGNLNVCHIVHLIPGASDVKHLQMCLEKGLKLAESKKLHSISLPAIGTGGYGMSALVSAKLVFQALASCSRGCVSIRNIRVVIKQEPIMKAFKQEQEKHTESSYAVTSTKPSSHTVSVTVMGKNQDSVDIAINELKNNISENCTSDEVEDEGVRFLSKSQINMLLTEAENCDVEMTVDPARSCIIVRGDRGDVHDMTKKINEEISQTRKLEKERQEHESALMISKTVEWSYKLEGEKILFDLSTNFKIEMAHSIDDPSIEVSSRGEKLVIDLQSKTGYRQPQHEPIAVTRKLKEADGKQF